MEQGIAVDETELANKARSFAASCSITLIALWHRLCQGASVEAHNVHVMPGLVPDSLNTGM